MLTGRRFLALSALIFCPLSVWAQVSPNRGFGLESQLTEGISERLFSPSQAGRFPTPVHLRTDRRCHHRRLADQLRRPRTLVHQSGADRGCLRQGGTASESGTAFHTRLPFFANCRAPRRGAVRQSLSTNRSAPAATGARRPVCTRARAEQL